MSANYKTQTVLHVINKIVAKNRHIYQKISSETSFVQADKLYENEPKTVTVKNNNKFKLLL